MFNVCISYPKTKPTRHQGGVSFQPATLILGSIWPKEGITGCHSKSIVGKGIANLCTI